MATNYPGGLDTYVALADNVDDVLAAHANDRGDAIEQLEIKLGVDASAVATSHDFFLKNVGGPYRVHGHAGGADDGAASIGPLTGLSLANNVDMGNFQVRAKQFYADVASGTAPFVIISDTQVSNLNVDRVDNLHLPATIADILTDHNKAAHDALNIDADTLDGHDTSYFQTAIGTFDSGWFNVSAGNSYVKNHNLGTQAIEWTLLFATDSGGSNCMVVQDYQQEGSDMRGGVIHAITTTQVTVTTGTNKVTPSYGGITGGNAVSGWYKILGSVV